MSQVAQVEQGNYTHTEKRLMLVAISVETMKQPVPLVPPVNATPSGRFSVTGWFEGLVPPWDEDAAVAGG